MKLVKITSKNLTEKNIEQALRDLMQEAYNEVYTTIKKQKPKKFAKHFLKLGANKESAIELADQVLFNFENEIEDIFSDTKINKRILKSLPKNLIEYLK